MLVEDGSSAVLIVEDSENSAATLEIAFLGIPGVSVRMASSGLEALRILNGDGGGIRAIVTDLNMPRMDGFELIRRIRQNRKLNATPIIVVSADTDPQTPEIGGIRAIVTDLNMPRMDGFELIRRIRQNRKLNATPIIVVSADTDPQTP